MMPHRGDFGSDLFPGFVVAPDKGEGGIAAKHPAVIGIDHAAARAMHRVKLDLVQPLQHETALRHRSMRRDPRDPWTHGLFNSHLLPCPAYTLAGRARFDQIFY